MKLYKYFTINDNFYSSIEESYLWFSKPSDFNDPFDCKMNLKKSPGRAGEQIVKNLSEDLRALLTSPMDRDEFAYLMMKKTYNDLRDKIGIVCFSEVNDNILMWSHYGDKHKGICIEFETDEIDLKNSRENLLPSKVNYSLEFPEHDPFIEHDMRSLYDSFRTNILLTKAKVWEYEHEFRFLSGRHGKHHFNQKAIKKIIFGAQCSFEDREKVLQTLRNCGYTGLAVRNVILHTNYYQLAII